MWIFFISFMIPGVLLRLQVKIPTCEVIIRPGAQLTGLAGVLIKHKFIFFAGGARPAATHFTFTDHLKETEYALTP